jgi:hypothetical protein
VHDLTGVHEDQDSDITRTKTPQNQIRFKLLLKANTLHWEIFCFPKFATVYVGRFALFHWIPRIIGYVKVGFLYKKAADRER